MMPLPRWSSICHSWATVTSILNQSKGSPQWQQRNRNFPGLWWTNVLGMSAKGQAEIALGKIRWSLSQWSNSTYSCLHQISSNTEIRNDPLNSFFFREKIYASCWRKQRLWYFCRWDQTIQTKHGAQRARTVLFVFKQNFWPEPTCSEISWNGTLKIFKTIKILML